MASRSRSLRTILLGTAAAVAVWAGGGELRAQTATQEVLPRPEAPFAGQIGTTYKDSKADYPNPVKAPPGSPNVLIVILDDVGLNPTRTGLIDVLRRFGARVDVESTSIHAAEPIGRIVVAGERLRVLQRNIAEGGRAPIRCATRRDVLVVDQIEQVPVR